MRHKFYEPVIRVTGDTATSYAYVDVDYLDEETDEVLVVSGHYHDLLIREEVQGVFKQRTTSSLYIWSRGTPTRIEMGLNRQC